MIQLMSRWGKSVGEEQPLPEYPRPTLVRDSYLNLNGEWEYCINESEFVDKYDGKILVPYSPETKLSGVKKIVYPKDILHYRKTFVFPERFKRGKTILHFEAVDQECKVWLNGVELGEHRGGYLRFSFDVTDYLKEGENELLLSVRDRTEESSHARGKQKLVKKGKYGSLFYTPQSGIWKTVWMESVTEEYVESIKVTPIYDEDSIDLYIKTNGNSKANVMIMDRGKPVVETIISVNKNCRIQLGNFISWTPEYPHLYDMKIVVNQDKVMSYFGMRKFSVEKDKRGTLRFFLNNQPFIFNGVLDQGYWPESLLTHPTEEALKYDIQKLKDLGFNTIRKHIKIESERFYYACDRLGMMVWQDMPNGGGEYNMAFVTYLTNKFDWFARGVQDNHYEVFKRNDEEGRRQYYRDLEGMVDQLYNYPSIAVWVPFNEGWGQFDARKATELIKKMDDTRFVNEACGWFDQKGGDIYSIHNYSEGLEIQPQKDRVVALTEFGGYAYAIPGHLACEKEFGYREFKSKEELTESYIKLWKEEIFPNLGKGLSAIIYTQTSDIEEEINGIFTYDREEVKFVEKDMREMNQILYQTFEKVTAADRRN